MNTEETFGKVLKNQTMNLRLRVIGHLRPLERIS